MLYHILIIALLRFFVKYLKGYVDNEELEERYWELYKMLVEIYKLLGEFIDGELNVIDKEDIHKKDS